MPLQINPLRSNSTFFFSLFLSFFLWTAQVCHLNHTFYLLFPYYWDVLKEIQNFCKFSTRTVRCMQGNADSFGGNLSTHLSIWIDAKLQLMVDPLLLIQSLGISQNADMAISKHPYFVHTMEEAIATARWKKWWDVNALKMQMETYCENGLQPWSPTKLPYASDVPDSALTLRKHELSSDLFSCLIFNELEAFNPRDQLAFAFVRDHMKPKLKLNIYEVEVFEQVTMEYRHNLKPSDLYIAKKLSMTRKTVRAEPDLLYENGSCCSRCHHYLTTMWGDSHQ
ncbi:hypothetical protein JHK82_020808 [Glycine max]|nr:hypothetical protein JHK85_021259 [Glycine max]KAG5136077.1 hypothetical protein JHK82_020808 [Glycine max]